MKKKYTLTVNTKKVFAKKQLYNYGVKNKGIIMKNY